jgi:DNA-binding CsgD family transcriptional regulator
MASLDVPSCRTDRRDNRAVPHCGDPARSELQCDGASSSAALDRLLHGVIITDARSRPLFANRAAGEIAAERDGLRLDAAGLGAACARETAALRWLIARVSSARVSSAAVGGRGIGGAGEGSAARAMSISRPSLRRPLTVLVTPLRTAAAAPGAIVFVCDPERAMTVPAALLQQAYGLTPMEAAVAIEIARGEGLGKVVDTLGISRSTGRTHLQRAFDKTGTRRQAQLAWLIAESCAGLRLGDAGVADDRAAG